MVNIITTIMATLEVEVSKTTIRRNGPREDGIRLSHHHEQRLIQTGM